jgi:hypothetical protein
VEEDSTPPRNLLLTVFAMMFIHPGLHPHWDLFRVTQWGCVQLGIFWIILEEDNLRFLFHFLRLTLLHYIYPNPRFFLFTFFILWLISVMAFKRFQPL